MQDIGANDASLAIRVGSGVNPTSDARLACRIPRAKEGVGLTGLSWSNPVVGYFEEATQAGIPG